MNIEPLSKAHGNARRHFDCGVEELNRYLREQAGQDIRSKVAATFVLLDNTRTNILGYYTLSALSIRAHEMRTETTRGLPKYPYLPATLIGRLAVQREHHGQGLGEHLLVDALHRSLDNTKTVGSVAVVVDAKNDEASAFYRRYGFLQFPDQTHRLFLPMKTIERLRGLARGGIW